MQGIEPQPVTIIPDEVPVVRMSTRDGGRRVLVLDDNDLVRQTVVRVLRQHGYEAHAAATGADALVLLQEFTFGLMYCDVRLEEESGIDLLPVIRAVAPGLPVVMVSGINESGLAVEAMRAGAVDYVTKPLETKRFLGMTERLLGQVMLRESRPLAHSVSATATATVAAVEVQQAAATRQLVQIVDKLVTERRAAPPDVPALEAASAPRRAPLTDRDPPIPQGPALIVLPPPRHVPWRVRVSLTLRRFGFRRGVPISYWAA